jgi:hypothetical protein
VEIKSLAERLNESATKIAGICTSGQACLLVHRSSDQYEYNLLKDHSPRPREARSSWEIWRNRIVHFCSTIPVSSNEDRGMQYWVAILEKALSELD